MTDIADLFRTDPLQLTNYQIDEQIAKFRSMRGQFALGNMKAGSTKPKKEPVVKGPKLDIKLDLKTLLAAKK